MSDWEQRGEYPGQPAGGYPYQPPPPGNAYPQGPPPGYPGYGYGPPPGYAPPPGYGGPPGEPRPGTLTAAAVLGYVCAGLLILAGILLFLGASVVANLDNLSGAYLGDYTFEFSVDGVVNLIAAGLLIGGSVMMAGRNPTGRLLYFVAGGIVVVETIYWLARWASRTDGAVVFYALLYAALVVVGMSLAATGGGSRWLNRSTG